MVATALGIAQMQELLFDWLVWLVNDATLYKGDKVAEAAVVNHPLHISKIRESQTQRQSSINSGKYIK